MFNAKQISEGPLTDDKVSWMYTVGLPNCEKLRGPANSGELKDFHPWSVSPNKNSDSLTNLWLVHASAISSK